MQINKLSLNKLQNLENDSSFQQSKQQHQDRFIEDDHQIDQEIKTLKHLYFLKRNYLVQVMKQLVHQKNFKTNKLFQLQLPLTIQTDRENQFVKSKNQSQFFDNNIQSSYAIRKKIIQDYRVKQQIHNQINGKKEQLQDSTNNQIKKIYQKKFGNFHFMNPYGSFMQDVNDSQQKNQDQIHNYKKTNISKNNNNQNKSQNQHKFSIQKIIKNPHQKSNNKRKDKKDQMHFINNQPLITNHSQTLSPNNIKKLNPSNLQTESLSNQEIYNSTVSINQNQSQLNKNSVKNKSSKVERNYMKIQDPYIGLQTSIVQRSSKQLDSAKNRIQQIDNSFQNQATYTKLEDKSERQEISKSERQEKQISKKSIAFSQRDSAYKNFIEKQTEELSKQKKRAQQLALEATKALNFQEDQNQNQQQDNSQNNFKNMFNQLIELFIISQSIKFQLKFRGFQIISKLYKEAQKYYEQKIQIKEPIQAKVFMIVIKPFLAQYMKSQIDVVINSIFAGKDSITFQAFVKAFTPILNQKQVLLLNDGFNNKQIQTTAQKTKKLFITLIQIKYFTTKIKQLLKKNMEICDKFINQTLFPDQQQYFDSALIQQYLTSHRKNNYKKMKIQIFFTHFIDKEMRKKTFLSWISKSQNNYFYQKKTYIK